MKDGNVLVIVIGGNISQLWVHHEGNEPKLTPATADKFHEFFLKNDGSSSVLLHESNNTKGKSIRVQFERLVDDTNNLEQQDSAQVNPRIWSELVKKIKIKSDNYEGIVVLHGLDTLAYTASAVSFMIRNLDMPIVFTGSQRPLNFLRSDAPQNIYTAITIAASKSLGLKPINEVTIYLHDTLFRANRASMSSASSYRSFDSLNYPALATIGEHIDIKEHLIAKSSSGNMDVITKWEANVQIIDVFPGMSSSVIEGLVENDLDRIYLEKLKVIAKREANDNGEIFEETIDSKILELLDKTFESHNQLERLANVLNNEDKNKALEIINRLDKKLLKDDNKVKGVILRTYGMGTAPTSPEVLKALKKLVDNKIIVMNVTQAHSSRVSFNSDPVSLRLFEQGVISGLDMTSEAAFAKMVVILSESKNIKKGLDHCEDELQKALSGEQSHTIINYHFLNGSTSEDENDYHSSILEFKNKSKDFSLSDDDLPKVDNIQLRILGLRKQTKGANKAEIKIIKYDDDVHDLKHEKEILKIEESLENPKDGESKTINVSYDITNLKNILFSKNAVFYVYSDQKIAWNRISIVIYRQ